MKDEREFLTLEAAEAILADGERVHTYQQAGPMLLGCDMDREDVMKLFREHRPQLAGPMATKIKHGIVVEIPGDASIFFATKD
jgi:hypothetical protein